MEYKYVTADSCIILTHVHLCLFLIKKVFEKTECTEEAKERVEKKKEVPERARRGKRDFMELCISILTNLYIMETSIIP